MNSDSARSTLKVIDVISTIMVPTTMRTIPWKRPGGRQLTRMKPSGSRARSAVADLCATAIGRLPAGRSQQRSCAPAPAPISATADPDAEHIRLQVIDPVGPETLRDARS
jgi:hypothetical protein